MSGRRRGRSGGALWAATFAAALLGVGKSAGELNLPPPSSHVEDRAGVLRPEARARLVSLLSELEKATGAQMIVLTIPSTQGEPIDRFSIRTASAWRLGQRGRDNGVLVTVAVEDRRYWIEVGYGLEAVLTDQFCGKVGREHFQPRFRRGDYSGGLVAGVSVLAERIAANSGVSLSGTAASPAARRSGSGGEARVSTEGAGSPHCACAGLALPALVVLLLVSRALTMRRYRSRRYWSSGGIPWWMWLLLSEGMRSSGPRRSSGDWGGWGHRGFGGGGWGGGFGGGSFGGGGGGRFGGGGAGGGW